MLQIVLYEPEIPPNTGNIIRLCANTGAQLHLIKPLGFHFDDKQLKRAGLDYHEWASVKIYDNFQHFKDERKPQKIWALTTKTRQCYSEASFLADDFLLFGPESRGLPEGIRAQYQDTCLRLPMQENSRSLNLSNTVAIVLYEAWRQLNWRYEGLSE